jgi:serine/threonine protein phosphatase PrpC
MGTYLSTPVTEKSEESGESLECPDVPCAWGVVDMQGWRKSMEDAHTAVTDISLPCPKDGDGRPAAADAKVFGVFDGHGGPEVARFCQLYLVSVLQKQPSWLNETLPTSPDETTLPNPDDQEACAETPVGKALRSAFHALDRMIDDPPRRCVILSCLFHLVQHVVASLTFF